MATIQIYNERFTFIFLLCYCCCCCGWHCCCCFRFCLWFLFSYYSLHTIFHAKCILYMMLLFWLAWCVCVGLYTHTPCTDVWLTLSSSILFHTRFTLFSSLIGIFQVWSTFLHASTYISCWLRWYLIQNKIALFYWNWGKWTIFHLISAEHLTYQPYWLEVKSTNGFRNSSNARSNVLTLLIFWFGECIEISSI